MIFRHSRKKAPHASPRTPGTVTIEDLLQLKKRAEQPPPEFWADFDRQLKERQRAAAIQEKPSAWWRVLPRIAIAIPAGATAAIAIGFIVWRSAPPSAPAPSPAPDTLERRDVHSAQNASTALAISGPRAAESAIAQPQPAATVAVVEQTPARATAAEAAVTQPVAPQHIETARNAFATIAPARSHRALGAGSIVFYEPKPQTTKATSTAALYQLPVVIDSDLVAALPPPATSIQPVTSIESIAAEAMQDAADPRRARLLTYTDNTIPVAAAATDNPRVTRLRERVTSRFDDKSLSDSISRIATSGDSLSIKF